MIKDLLELEVNIEALNDHNDNDIKNVLIRLDICREALDAFLAQEITFEEYLDLLKTAEVNIDDYLINTEQNLIKARLL
ncbi:hypothetical protein STA3757_30510 [Stanieria sp. NIES-3757]|nr:hypothetical protein STA3757_30510 [Stanieria sp. NIES-3757]